MRIPLVLVLFAFVLVLSSSAWASTLTYSGPSYYPTTACTDLKGSCPLLQQYGTFTITYVPSVNFVAGGRVRFGIGNVVGSGYLQGQAGTDLFKNWGIPQVTSPSAVNYVGVSSPVAASKSIIAGDVPFVQLAFTNGITAGTPVTVTFGDTSGGSPGIEVPPYESEMTLFAMEDPNKTNSYTMVTGSLIPLWVTGTHADRLVVVAGNSQINVGKRLDILVKAMEGPDSYVQNSYTDGVFTGTVTFTSTDPQAILPPPYTFTSADRGFKKFDAYFNTSGIQTISATVSSLGISGVSNPVEVSTKPSPKKVATVSSPAPDAALPVYSIFWGSLHNHTGVGGHANQTTDFAYRYARDRSLLNFVAISEHCWTQDFHFDQLVNLADSYNMDGKFVTFPAYEWTSASNGHRHVVFPNATNAWSFCETSGGQSVEKESTTPNLQTFLDSVANAGGIAILHHPAYTITQAVNWGPTNSASQRLVEMYSWHGRSEYYNNPLVVHNDPFLQFGPNSGNFVQDAIAAGYRLGFTADADNHFGMPGSNQAKGWADGYYARMGLTAVLARSETRADIWEALMARRTYGTTGARMIVKFFAAGHWMGEEYSTKQAQTFHVQVTGTAPLDYIKIFRDGKNEVYSWSGNGSALSADVTYTDTQVKSGETHSYYVRVHQTDDHYAWASPLWVTYVSGAGLAAKPESLKVRLDRIESASQDNLFPWGVTFALIHLLETWNGKLPVDTPAVTDPANDPEALAEMSDFTTDTPADNLNYQYSPQVLEQYAEGEITKEQADALMAARHV